jgi:menaquinone-dependent protoporphyrinogen oxidase
MARVLIVYSTTDGQTTRICDRLRSGLESRGDAVTVRPVEAAAGEDPATFDKIVIGASIRYGKHSRQILDYVGRHAAELASRPSAFFSVNIVARKPAKCHPQTNPYVQKFLRQTGWRPKELDVFAGRLDYPRYGPVDRQMIRLIMWITDGPTDPSAVVEFTDWQRVEAFAQRIANM